MERISRTDLEMLVTSINRTTKNTLEPYTRDKNGTYSANIGTYYLDGAYGGYALHQMETEAGGVRDVFRSGHITKRDLYNRMQAFLEGLTKGGWT